MNKFSRDRVKGFLHTDGRRMVNGDGKTVVLRGWGMGNWMNPEGFMIGGVPLFVENADFNDFALPRRFERGRTMETTVRELCGSWYARDYWIRWAKNYVTEEDIRLMAEMGYNSVRLPISSRLFLAEEPEIIWVEEGFAILDQVLDWCEKYKIYAILDMHGAPGGQSALACDDGLDNRPHMFTEPESRERAILLWEEFARRYADRWIVGGYDLINEPLSGPDCAYLIPELGKFYDELIPRIRKYDKNHMLTLEGAVFSMDMDIFDHEYDPECHNWCMHTHFYHFSPEVRDLYRFLDSSVRCNVPIWIGEGGSEPVDNSIYYEIAATFDIGYSIWSWKSADDPKGEGSGVVRYQLPKDWEPVRAYIRNGGPRPSYRESQKIMDEMLENIRMEHCSVWWEKNYYNLRQPGITLPAVGFDEGSEKANGWRFGNPFGYRTETGMKMVLKPDVKPPKHVVVPTREEIRPSNPLTDLCLELRAGEQASYTIRDVEKTCNVTAKLRSVDGQEGRVKILCTSLDGNVQERELTVKGTETAGYELAVLEAGAEWVVTVVMEAGSMQMDEITFAR